jgi:hypothetical protein
LAKPVQRCRGFGYNIPDRRRDFVIPMIGICSGFSPYKHIRAVSRQNMVHIIDKRTPVSSLIMTALNLYDIYDRINIADKSAYDYCKLFHHIGKERINLGE